VIEVILMMFVTFMVNILQLHVIVGLLALYGCWVLICKLLT
jgi:hypothetical protein